MSAPVLIQAARETFGEWLGDRADRLGAALAYYLVFALAPLLLIAIGIAGLVFGEQAARGQIVAEIETAVGRPFALAIQELLTTTGAPATVVGAVILLVSASGVFLQLQDALNTIWKVAPKPGRTLVRIIQDRLLSFLAVLATALVLLGFLIVSTALSAMAKFLPGDAVFGDLPLWEGINNAISLGVVALLFALLYKFLPDVHVPWTCVWSGAVGTAILFNIGKYAIALYLGQSGTVSVFGAAGSVVLILVWIYYSAQIFLFGAEWTRVCARRKHLPILPKANAVVTWPDQARPGVPQPQPVTTA